MIFSFFIQFFEKNSLSKQNSPRWDAAFCGVTSGAILFAYVNSIVPDVMPQNAASHLGLFCLLRENSSKNEIKIQITPSNEGNHPIDTWSALEMKIRSNLSLRSSSHQVHRLCT